MMALGLWSVALILLGTDPALITPPGDALSPSADGRLAVLILPDRGTDAALSDNLTEVVLARVAERHVQVVGTADFRRRLGMSADDRASACLDDLGCLGRVGVALGVRQVVTGSVRSEAASYIVNLVLTDIQTGKVSARFFRLVEGPVDALVAAAQEGTEELFRPRPEPGRLRIDSDPQGSRVNVDGVYVGLTPMISGPLFPGVHAVRVERDGHFSWKAGAQVPPGADLEIKLMDWQIPPRRRWPTTVATGALVGAGFSVGLAAILGTLSQVTPAGTTRRDVQDELSRQHTLATSANLALGVGAALALAATVVYAGYRRDIVGE